MRWQTDLPVEEADQRSAVESSQRGEVVYGDRLLVGTVQKIADEAHLAAMDAMRDLMQDPDAMEAWFEDRRREFESLPDD